LNSIISILSSQQQQKETTTGRMREQQRRTRGRPHSNNKKKLQLRAVHVPGGRSVPHHRNNKKKLQLANSVISFKTASLQQQKETTTWNIL
jgi:hypothetical protein